MCILPRLPLLVAAVHTQASTSAGAAGVEDLARAGGSGTTRNVVRDMTRRLARGSTMPSLYFAECRLHDDRRQQDVLERQPFLLPHEVLGALGVDHLQTLVRTSHDAVEASAEGARCRELCAAFNVDYASCLFLGLHGDGVPYSQKDTCQVLTWNLASAGGSERIVFTVLPKKHSCKCCKGVHTIDDALEVFRWSITQMLAGRFPTTRHDGSSWAFPEDRQRARWAGKPLGYRGFLTEARGDWAHYKQVFRFPSWSSQRLCWKCNITRDLAFEFGDNPEWASPSQRVSEGAFFQSLRETGQGVSPIFGCPGMTLAAVRVDVLHTLDLGVTQDVAGHVLWECMHELYTGNPEQKLAQLKAKLRQYYQEFHAGSQIDNLTKEMLKKPGKAPKLRAKGAETRHLVPFLVILCNEAAPARADAHGRTRAQMSAALMDFYLQLGHQPFNAAAAKARGARFLR